MSALTLRPLGRTGLEITSLGLGGAPLGNLFSAVSEENAQDTLDTAWRHGWRLFDTAPFYGRGLSERRFGAFLSGKPRETFVISTKVGRALVPAAGPVRDSQYEDVLPFEIVYDYSADGAKRSLESSLERLRLDRIDIVYIHDVGADTHGAEQPRRYREALDGAWRALSDLRTQRVVKAIGLGVNDWRVCVDLLRDADPDCFLLAGRYTLLEQDPIAGGLFDALERRGASLVIGGVFNSGILAGDGGTTYEYKPAPPAVRRRVEALRAVADEHAVPLPAAALAFPLAHERVAAIVVGARRASEIAENAALAELSIPGGFWQDLKGRRLLDPRAPVPRA